MSLAGVESVLLAVTRIDTFVGAVPLTGASGFFFRRSERWFVVTNRHVLFDEPTRHFPDRIEVLIHTHERDLTQHVKFSIPLYRDGRSLWRAAVDSEGEVDVAVMELETSLLPPTAQLSAFDPTHIGTGGKPVPLGDPLTVVGFPLGFHDTLHYLAVARGASIASAYGVRFQGQGYFLTDARTHRGSSGSPVLRRRHEVDGVTTELPWQLLGVHSTRMDMSTRDAAQDESLGLNCAWYADVLRTLTQ